MAQVAQRSFTSGEISPAVAARADLNKYRTALGLCENFITRSQGGVYSRPGFRFIDEIGDSSRKARLLPFSFNVEQTYVLVFEHETIRFITNGAYVMDGGSPYELASPYQESELPRLAFTQSADVMTICHPNHPPTDLRRLANDEWELVEVDFSPPENAPAFNEKVGSQLLDIEESDISYVDDAVVINRTHDYEEGETAEIRLYASSPGGTFLGISAVDQVKNKNIAGNYFTVVMAAGDSNFSTDRLSLKWADGEYMKSLEFGPYSPYFNMNSADPIAAEGSGEGDFGKLYEYVVTSVDVDGIESLPSPATAIFTGSLSQTAGVRLVWRIVPNVEYFRVYKAESEGSLVYGWIGDSESLSFIDYNIAPIVSDTPPGDRNPLKDGNNPSVVSYYQQRRFFANLVNEPQTVVSTQIANYSSFRTSRPLRDDDAITFTIAAKQVNEIRHIITLDSMIILTSGGEWIVTEGQDQVLTPATVGVRPQSFNGSGWVTPVVVDATALFVQNQGTRVRDLGYQFDVDKYVGNDLSLLSEHLFEGHEIVEMTFAGEPYGIVWVLRDDGVLLGLTYQREHQVWGWHHHTTDGEFESMAVIDEDGRDALYVIVKREVDGSTVRYVERLERIERLDAKECFYVDSGLSYDGAPESTFTNLDHLEGKGVVALADGNVVEDLTVTGGSVTLPFEASVVHVGLPYTPAIETLDIDPASVETVLKGKDLSISKVQVSVEKSRGLFIAPKRDYGQGFDKYQEVKPRFVFEGYDPIGLHTFNEEVFIEPQWGQAGGLRIEQRHPLPLNILTVIPNVDVGGI